MELKRKRIVYYVKRDLEKLESGDFKDEKAIVNLESKLDQLRKARENLKDDTDFENHLRSLNKDEAERIRGETRESTKTQEMILDARISEIMRDIEKKKLQMTESKISKMLKHF
jgi:hypothetical protein